MRIGAYQLIFISKVYNNVYCFCVYEWVYVAFIYFDPVVFGELKVG